MKKTILAILALVALAGGAEWIVLASAPVEPAKLAAALVSLALVLALFVALTDEGFVRIIRTMALESHPTAVALPLVLLVPYVVFALGTETWSWTGAGKLTAYVLAPTLFVLPDRMRRAESVTWRDFAAMAALAAPVMAGWLTDIWTWPRELYFFRPMYSVIAGAYAFLAVRGLQGVGYKLLWRWGDAKHGFVNFVGFTILGIPLGLALNFIHPHATPFASVTAHFLGQSFRTPGGVVLAGNCVLIFAGIYLTAFFRISLRGACRGRGASSTACSSPRSSSAPRTCTTLPCRIGDTPCWPPSRAYFMATPIAPADAFLPPLSLTHWWTQHGISGSSVLLILFIDKGLSPPPDLLLREEGS